MRAHAHNQEWRMLTAPIPATCQRTNWRFKQMKSNRDAVCVAHWHVIYFQIDDAWCHRWLTWMKKRQSSTNIKKIEMVMKGCHRSIDVCMKNYIQQKKTTCSYEKTHEILIMLFRQQKRRRRRRQEKCLEFTEIQRVFYCVCVVEDAYFLFLSAYKYLRGRFVKLKV